MDAQWLYRLCPDLHQKDIFLCDPQSFMDTICQAAEQAKCDLSRLHREPFTPSHSSPSSPQVNATYYRINLPQFERYIQAASGQSILQALEAEGLPIIGACRNGICGSCKCKVHQGQIRTTTSGPLSEKERNEGYILACSSEPSSDLDISW
ncbi:2Fe-2S iron-sulfur cluster-binding protein [Celerinatantimonas yamalensis]|uniref:2Fe-2S iron-sulfur cluster-binding protein n=1 Tax=Celerinatantimonas yamalensis TaxID=559956 RepID=A0ABW9G5E3_9GAMM